MNRDASEYSRQVVHGAYFAHIDGIRALAIIPVVLFHLAACLCPGGYAGVDVFFVISGYLITGGILRDAAKGKFTVAGFYHRRIRRILPAFLAVVLAVFLAGTIIYYAVPLVRLADTVVAGTLFSSNVYFWMQGGDYFAADVHTNPLLHLWTLSVEEQFYLVIPLLVATVWKVRPRLVAPVLSLLAAVSLALAIHGLAAGNRLGVFYLLPYRGWELLAGSLLAMLPAATGGRRAGWMAACGLALVLVPYALYSPATRFPGAAALPFVVGTVLLIRYGQSGWVTQLLSWRPMVATGKISYSLYLWHWPVIVYWKYMTYDQLYVWDYFGMVILAVVLASLSWRWVEMPVRTAPTWTPRRSFAFAATGMCLMVALGGICLRSGGWPRLHLQANQLAGSATVKVEGFLESELRRYAQRFVHGIAENKSGQSRRLGDPNRSDLCVLGDSHAWALFDGLDASLRERHAGGWAVAKYSHDMFNLDDPECRSALQQLACSPGCANVFLVQFWLNPRLRQTPQDFENTYARVEAFANRLRAMGKTLYIATDVPIWKRAPCELLARQELVTPRKLEDEWDGTQCLTAYEQAQGGINRRLDEICHRTGAVLIPLQHAVERDGQFIACDRLQEQPVPLYTDSHHLSYEGSRRAAKLILAQIFPETAPSVTPSARCVGLKAP